MKFRAKVFTRQAEWIQDGCAVWFTPIHIFDDGIYRNKTTYKKPQNFIYIKNNKSINCRNFYTNIVLDVENMTMTIQGELYKLCSRYENHDRV